MAELDHVYIDFWNADDIIISLGHKLDIEYFTDSHGEKRLALVGPRGVTTSVGVRRCHDPENGAASGHKRSINQRFHTRCHDKTCLLFNCGLRADPEPVRVMVSSLWKNTSLWRFRMSYLAILTTRI